MNEIAQNPIVVAVITGAVTIITGVLIYVMGQYIQNFVLKPIQDFRVMLTEISHKVKFWSNYLTNSGLREDKTQQSQADMRDLSSNLESKYVVIPFKRILVAIRAIPTPEDVRVAAQNLIFLSNAGGEAGSTVENSKAINSLKQKLNLTL